MKKLLQISALILMIFMLAAPNSYAQIGNLKNLKDKASKVKSGKSKDKSSVTKLSGGAYQKHMNEGNKLLEDKKYIEALSEFKAALTEKSGDYSATQQVDKTEKLIEDAYFDKIEAEIKNYECEQAENDLNIAVEALGRWGQENYFRREIEKCKANAGSHAAASEKKAKIDALKTNTANFYSDYASKNFSNSLTAADDLFVKFKLEKPMTEYFSEFGIEKAYNAYGFFTVYIDGKKAFTDGPFMFQSNYASEWTNFDLPLSVSPDFVKTLQTNPSLLSTNQDVWLLQQVANPGGITRKYIMAAIQNMPAGTHKVKVEFGLGEKSDKTPKGTVASGELNVKADAASLKELYKRGPKYMRPLEDNEIGKIVFSNTAYKLGNGAVNMSLKLPQAPKYYNMKWCQSSSCDYDHGELMFEVELDGKYLASWVTTFWDADYESKTDFSTIMIPANDKDFNNDLSDFNSSDFFRKVGNNNPVPYAIFDLLYSGKLSAGKHKLSIKVMSPEAVAPELTYEASKKYYDKINPIAINTLNFTVDAGTKSRLESASTAKKLSHAGGAWASVDATLKRSSTDGLATILDVAAYTKWKVTVNAFGTPLYRTCKASVTYKNKNGAYRVVHGVQVKEDYQGNGGYGSPYFTDIMNNYYTASPGFLNPAHYPIPASRAK